MRARVLRGLLAFAGSSALLFAAFEGTLRMAVHAETGPLRTLADPWRYGGYASDDAYWEMRVLAGPPQALQDSSAYDQRYGWRSRWIEEGTLRHGRESELAGRRPLLLFGDSYARGINPETQRDFREYFERSDLAPEFSLLNYGVGGYGIDQVWLLLRDVLARHAQARPVVLVSLLVDDDLDRCVLSFRGWPKPRLALEENRLVGDDHPVPRMQEYFARHASVSPLHARAFLARYGERFLGGRESALELEKQALSRALLVAITEELRSHGLPFLFVLFRHSFSLERPEATGWRAPLLSSTLDGLGAPWVTVGPALREHSARTERALEEYFLPPDHPHSGHLNPLGDAVAFEVMREGLRRHLGLGEGGNLVLAQDVRPAGGSARLEWREHDEQLAARGLIPPYLWAVLDDEGRAELHWTPAGNARALRARVTLEGEAELHLSCDRDGSQESVGERLELDLTGVTRLTLRAEGPPGGRVVLSEVALEPARRVPPPLDPYER